MMTVVFVLLLSFGCLLAIVVSALTSDFQGSDAAGNAMAQGFAFLGAIVFWIVAGILLLLCGARAGFSGVRVIAVIVAVTFAVTSQFMAMALLQNMRGGDRFETLLAVGASGTMFVVLLYAGWAFFTRATFAPVALNMAAAVLLVATCSITWVAKGPVEATNLARIQAWQAERAKDEALKDEVLALPASTPLVDFLKYTDVPPENDTEARRTALARMQKLPDRQAEVEDLLAKQDTRVLRQVRLLDVKATPKVCEGGKLTARKVAEMLKPAPTRATFDQVESTLNVYMDGIEWLKENGCDMKEEIGGIEQSIRMYPDSFSRKLSIDYLGELQGRPRQP
jgi:hypothetical protein